MIRRLLLLVLVGILAVGAVVVVRARRFATRQPTPPPAEPLAVDSAGAIDRLARAVQVPTVSRGGATTINPDALRRLHRMLQDGFPRVHAALARDELGGSLLYTWPGADSTLLPLLLMGHMDVVPADSAGWTYPPFSGAVARGYVWGRGTLDDKVGVLGQLEAVEALVGRAFHPRRTVYFAFGHDEEIGGRSGAAAISALLRARGVRLAAVIDEGGAILTGVVPGVAAPVATVGVAEKGGVSLALTARVAGGHASMPPARTAIGLVSRAIERLTQHQFPASLRASRGLFDAVGPEMSWPYRTLFSNLWLFEPLLLRRLTAVPSTAAAVRTTIAPTIVEGGDKENVLPGTARAVVNLRILPGETIQSTVDRVRRIVADTSITISVIGDNADPSPVSPADGPAFQALAIAIRQIYPDAVVAPYLVLGATDARHYASLTPNVYRFLPVPLTSSDLERLHGVDERIGAGAYLQAVRVYAQIIRGLGQ